MTTTPKYPNVSVRLIGESDNAFSILARVRTALKRGGVSVAEIDTFYDEATTGDYNHLLQTVMAWVEVE